MQFTNAIIILAALTGFTTAAPVAEVDERSSGTALTFFSVNGTATGMTAPKGWAPIKPSKSRCPSSYKHRAFNKRDPRRHIQTSNPN